MIVVPVERGCERLWDESTQSVECLRQTVVISERSKCRTSSEICKEVNLVQRQERVKLDSQSLKKEKVAAEVYST